MKKILSCAAAILVSLGCHAGKIKIVATLPDLRSIAEMVAGDRAETFSIATGYQNPHFVDPKPSYIMKLAHADLFITVGLDLESGWSPSLLASSRNAKIQKGSAGYVDASAGIALMQVPASADRSQGDIHIYGNPHYWLDPVNGKQIARNIYEGLVRISPSDRAYFADNLKRFNEMLEAKLKTWAASMASLHGTPVIAYHNEWCYFENRFGLRIIDFLEPKPGIPPTPSQLARIIGEVKEQHIRVIITSPYFPASSAEVVSRQTGARTAVLATSVGAFDDVRTYFDLFDHNIRILTQLLR